MQLLVDDNVKILVRRYSSKIRKVRKKVHNSL